MRVSLAYIYYVAALFCRYLSDDSAREEVIAFLTKRRRNERRQISTVSNVSDGVRVSRGFIRTIDGECVMYVHFPRIAVPIEALHYP